MDILQTALVFMVFIVCVFLIIFGVMFFMVLRDLKRGLDKMNNMLVTGEEMMAEMGKPVTTAMKLLSILGIGTKVASLVTKIINSFVNKTSKNSATKIREVK